jgi:hypothetical protein
MKHCSRGILLTLGILSVALGAMGSPAQAGLSGTFSVGPTGSYATLTAACADLTAQGLSGAVVLELQQAYVSTGETFPLVIGAFAGAGATNTVTIRPETGATTLTISSASATGTVDLNGAAYVTIDGRPGGTGAARELTIENTHTSGWALRFINEAQTNTVHYATVKGVNTGASSGVVLFSTTTGISGNDNNTIDSCDLHDGATTPTNLVYSAGSTGTTAQNNSGGVISNCNIYNFFNATATHVGVSLGSGNQNWTIQGNSFYQTAARNMTGTGTIECQAVASSSASTNGIQVLGNWIGGSAPQCAGAAMTYTGNATVRALRMTVGTTVPTSIQGNTFDNVAVTSTSASSSQTLIGAVSGSFNIGTVTPNTIGSQSLANRLVYSLSNTSTAAFNAISCGTGTPGVITVANNTIGGIAVSGVSGTGTAPARGITIAGSVGTYTISNNTIGSPSVANSFTSSASGAMGGIYSTSSGSANTITDNRIENLAYLGTASVQLIGISAPGSSGGIYTVTGNRVSNLSTASTSTSTGTSAPLIGISLTAATTAGQTLSQNLVHSLTATSPTAAVCITGIHVSAPSSGTNTVARNFVHGLWLSTSGINNNPSVAQITGININGGVVNYLNNMVQLGFDASGSPITTGYSIAGIYENVGTNNFYGNSVYVGGSGVAANQNTFGFESSVSVNTRSYEDNIFVNARSNASGAGKNYAVRYGTVDAGHASNYNDFYAPGVGGMLGGTGAGATITDYATLATWQAGTGRDPNTIAADPLYVAPAGSAATADLHIQTGIFPVSPVANAGTGLALLTNDFDGEARGAAPDIGADEFVNYQMTATAGPDGSISPSGSFLTNAGTDLTFTMTPADCYVVSDVLVDGTSVGAVTTYTFTNIQADHTISVSFTPAIYVVQAAAGPGGAIDPAGAVPVPCGTDKAFAIAPSDCYRIADVLVDGTSVGPVTSYTFTNVRGDHTIEATFAPLTYTIVASAGTGGSIDPAGAVVVNCGAEQRFTIRANDCSTIADVLVDGASVGPVTEYVFTDVRGDHTISASFAITRFTLTTGVVGNGTLTIDPDLPLYDCGASVQITAQAAPGWQFHHWAGDAGGNVNPLTIVMNANKSITAVFVDITPPEVTLHVPNGGEVWEVGSTHAISWTATDNVGVTSVDLACSLDGGATYPLLIGNGLPNSGSDDWTIPNDPSTQVRVRVTAHDAAANDAFDASDANFEIRSPQSAVAEVLLADGEVMGVYPNPTSDGQVGVLYRMSSSAGLVSVAVYDVRGRLVRQLESGPFYGGIRSLTWDGRDDNGREVSQGIYLVRLTTDTGIRATKRLAIFR